MKLKRLLKLVVGVPLALSPVLTATGAVGGLNVEAEVTNNNPPPTDAPTADLDRVAFDENLLHNGFTQFGNPVVGEPVAGRSFRDNKLIYEEQESIGDGVGPTYNALSCAECHQNPTTGAISQVTELRAGHLSNGNFVDAPGGSLIHSRAIATAIQEFVPDGEDVQALRTSLNTMGDGFVECISNTTLIGIRDAQPSAQRGTAIAVPTVESRGALRVGRFGWKNQHASLVSFSGDAYLNEMGITSPFQSVEAFINPANIVENSSLGRSVARYDLVAEPEDEGEDVGAFADFMRATRAPGRAENVGAPNVQSGQALFTQIGCAVCHTPTIVTAPAGVRINNGQFTVPSALGSKTIHPFGDFLLHDIGTGDGIVQNGGQGTRNMVRTPPLWGVRSRNRLMHDGTSTTFTSAIGRHAGQASAARSGFNGLSAGQKADVLAFLQSL
jgi:CxxC motif-containing protein (DUF1111 family)